MIEQKDELLVNHLAKQGVDDKMVMGHPAGLFVLFFTEMWERFSYYGMRALLTLFLVSSLADGGWEWTRADALKLYGWYTGLVYLTPIIGGIIADRLMGFRKAIFVGALIMTLGHASMAMEGFSQSFFFLGLALMIIGNGLFKPNISSMVGQIYPDNSAKKDAGYTIFYMGINSGAFLGMLLCGYIGEKEGWHLGFGLAGIFMFFGMLQFYFARKYFGRIGEAPKEAGTVEQTTTEDDADAIPEHVRRDRLIVIGVLILFSTFFWLAFEQAGGSMNIFAADYTQRVLTGNAAITFKWVDAALTLFPLIILTSVLFGLSKKLLSTYPKTIICTFISMIIIWVLGVWKIQREFTALETEVAASWFQILNSFFIITLATVFSKIWEKVWNPSGPIKFALALLLLGTGFAALAYGCKDIPQGAQTASVSMVWLILAYFFHTTGELCLSPVGLSYVSKLSPKKLLGLIFGLWFASSAIANFAGSMLGSTIDYISTQYSMAHFFGIFAVIPGAVAVILILLSPKLKKMMHGIN
ncbi:POT family proton-dependent oligopeptide transporter [Sphingobacterium allocomposti]|uniref:POT family proton-dependent oligopeptide transporter n=1 Tax=Sphingobacterium allocomposti TaxID=415956 RepID=A0A5S5DE86_9SPHI|nr:peptide MFS transporter [Sphingobacterium composti Yoo et al. 2007 non Ten et al. 2007]TYP94357.1 POT family proton-dependent oligopeptide transporter [Sphingobacterium composti Yoo et al. 2007 non Ten et al. 2007]